MLKIPSIIPAFTFPTFLLLPQHISIAKVITLSSKILRNTDSNLLEDKTARHPTCNIKHFYQRGSIASSTTAGIAIAEMSARLSLSVCLSHYCFKTNKAIAPLFIH